MKTKAWLTGIRIQRVVKFSAVKTYSLSDNICLMEMKNCEGRLAKLRTSNP